jgi:hypothetical protein
MDLALPTMVRTTTLPNSSKLAQNEIGESFKQTPLAHMVAKTSHTPTLGLTDCPPSSNFVNVKNPKC